MVKIFCVLVKPKYTFGDVQRLYNSISKNINQKFEFVCLTDHETMIYNNIDMINVSSYDLETWWNKVLMFDRKYSGDVNLYFDLDVDINSPIDPLIDQIEDEHITVVDTPWKDSSYFAQKYKGVRAYKIADALFYYGNTSVMGWKGNKQHLVDLLLSDLFTHTSQHYGDDTFINKNAKIKYFDYDIQRFFPGVPEKGILINYKRSP
jgi:hypothetical protein